MKKIKILWVSACAPVKKASEAGGKTFYYYFNQFVKDDRFDIRLIALAKDCQRNIAEEDNKGVESEFIYYESISRIKKLVNIESRLNLFNARANLLSNSCVYKVLTTAKAYKQSGYRPDIIILEWTQVVVLAKYFKSIFPNSKIVASEHDITFVGFDRKRKYFNGLKKVLWNIRYFNEKRVELNSLKKCDCILPQNPDNISLLCDSGIDQRNIKWLIPYFNNMSIIQRSNNNNDILFFGAMARPENYLSAIWFIEKVMPLLEGENVRFIILGSNPPEELNKYVSENVVITGFVDDIKEYFIESACLVAPLVLGAGIKVKVLEALSSGIPVLTNTIGIEGIPARRDIEYLHCEEPNDYADEIMKLLRGKNSIIGENGRAFVKSTYNLQQSVVEYKELLVEMVRK